MGAGQPGILRKAYSIPPEVSPEVLDRFNRRPTRVHLTGHSITMASVETLASLSIPMSGNTIGHWLKRTLLLSQPSTFCQDQMARCSLEQRVAISTKLLLFDT